MDQPASSQKLEDSEAREDEDPLEVDMGGESVAVEEVSLEFEEDFQNDQPITMLDNLQKIHEEVLDEAAEEHEVSSEKFRRRGDCKAEGKENRCANISPAGTLAEDARSNKQ